MYSFGLQISDIKNFGVQIIMRSWFMVVWKFLVFWQKYLH